MVCNAKYLSFFSIVVEFVLDYRLKAETIEGFTIALKKVATVTLWPSLENKHIKYLIRSSYVHICSTPWRAQIWNKYAAKHLILRPVFFVLASMNDHDHVLTLCRIQCPTSRAVCFTTLVTYGLHPIRPSSVCRQTSYPGMTIYSAKCG